ncbi:MAG: hypothetical protein IKK09_05095 [Clostridia bacterium]|nr:hypothetical protein [Clostridia bacterium]
MSDNKNTSLLDKIKIILDFISVFIIGFSGVYISNQATKISKQQSDISMMNTPPYFEISSYNNEEKQIGYTITNIGGYIQSAQIVLKSIINVNIQNFGGEDFYFVYQTMKTDYSNLKDNEFIIEFKYSSFGLSNWEYNKTPIIQTLSTKFDEKDIWAFMSYMEYLEVRYIDITHEIHTEYYLIGENEDNTLFLSSLYEPNLEIEANNNIYSDFAFCYNYNNIETKKKIGTTALGGSGRYLDAEYIFVKNICEVIDNYIEEINLNLENTSQISKE